MAGNKQTSEGGCLDFPHLFYLKLQALLKCQKEDKKIKLQSKL